MPPFISRHYRGTLPQPPQADTLPPARDVQNAVPGASAPSAQAAGLPSELPDITLPHAVPLPDVAGPQAPMHAVQSATGAAFGDNIDVSGFTAWELLYRAATRSQHMQGQLRRGANQGMVTAKLKEVQLTQDQILGQNRSAKYQFASNLAVSVMSAGAGTLASSVLGPVASQVVSQGVQQVGKPALDLGDRIHPLGGMYRANQAGLSLKRTAVDVQSDTQQVEMSRAAQDQAQEELRAAAQFISGYIQRKSEVSDRQSSR